MIKNKSAALLALSLLLAFSGIYPAMSQEPSFSWKRFAMDESRTGTKASSNTDVKQSLGNVRGCIYFSPNGRRFRGGVTPKVAGIVLDAQPKMHDVKEVIAYSSEKMVSRYPESALSNWFVDEIIRAVAEKTGKRVDVGIANFGGIRTDMPKGNVLLDDIMSMFPFKNNLCYVELKGSDLKNIFEQMASTSFQVVGGVRCVVKDRKLVSALVDGKPLDDGKVYGVATISFLLNGGDGLSVAKNAENVTILPGYIIDYMLPYVKSLTAAGKPIEYQADGRVKIYD
ncbi:MAG: 5'-nucleotidase C-terminal domain-containing protein [Bacteroidales bacterium]|nr:5'-nucleotidase C-terminal domain-containing protein [Bacteroidales bacterium]MCI1785822.1 5'-nucleotidase C-terminal domain-containing protein [Bacteroidales bacterium]